MNSVPPVANLIHPDFEFLDGVNKPRDKAYMLEQAQKEDDTSGKLSLFQEGQVFGYKMVQQIQQKEVVSFGVVTVKEGMILKHEERR